LECQLIVLKRSEGNLAQWQRPFDLVSISFDVATELERQNAEGVQSSEAINVTCTDHIKHVEWLESTTAQGFGMCLADVKRQTTLSKQVHLSAIPPNVFSTNQPTKIIQ